MLHGSLAVLKRDLQNEFRGYSVEVIDGSTPLVRIRNGKKVWSRYVYPEDLTDSGRFRLIAEALSDARL